MAVHSAGIEAGAGIMDDQLKFRRCSRQRYVALTHAAVLQCVVNGLLQNTKQAQRDFVRERLGKVLDAELNVQALPL